MEGFVEGINPITMEKLRRGEFSVQKILDLHGYSIDDADELFQIFIKDTVREGLKCVKIIHGRGLKSKGAPVLKEHLKTWIIKAMHRKWVLAFSNAIMSDGGPGATYILLKKNPVKKQIHIMGKELSTFDNPLWNTYIRSWGVLRLFIYGTERNYRF